MSEAAATSDGLRSLCVRVTALLMTLFVLVEVNYPQLGPQSQLAIFTFFGLVTCFLTMPVSQRWATLGLARAFDWALVALSALVCGFVVVQNEPALSSMWLSGSALGDRAGAEVPLDYWIGAIGLLLVLEAARRAVGMALPLLAAIFLVYAYFGQSLPDMLFPHRGYDWPRIVSQAFLHSQGVFGIALKVMFSYVFLFVVFGSLLEITGATRFIIEAARRVFAGSSGGAAKVSVLSSGLMGSLSGSAVANTATTGTFTIPLMRSAGFKREIAGGIEAAASSGGALVPPVMGAGAYMMLEIIDPPVTYLQIVKAAIVPAVLYYVSLFLIVHFYAKRLSGDVGRAAALELAAAEENAVSVGRDGGRWAGAVFLAGLSSLIVFLLMGFTVFRAVTLAMGVVLLFAVPVVRTRPSWGELRDGLERSARAGAPLVAAAAAVGIVIGVVTLTGVGTRLPSAILPLAQSSLLLALFAIMMSSLILGMGLPSAVCYLLLATLIGPVLGQLGVVPLAAHLFIFYFGMMAMVTPPVALAAYTAASIADSGIMKTGMAAFRFALVGFTLPYMFVLRPELLLLSQDGGPGSLYRIVVAISMALLGIVALAAGIAGFFRQRLALWQRAAALAIAFLLLLPWGGELAGSGVTLVNLVGAAGLVVLFLTGRSTLESDDRAG